MTETRNPGILLVSEEKYLRIIRRTGVLGLVIGVILIAGFVVAQTLGATFNIAGVQFGVLGLLAIVTGVVTILIAGRFPHVSSLSSWVSSTASAPLLVGFLGALATVLLAADFATGLMLALIVLVVAFSCSMLARANKLVLRTAAALIEPTREK